jgi:hypothetical protein
VAEPTSPEQTAADQAAPAAQGAVQVNDKVAIPCYANFCRVTGTPEELLLDFGLNANVPGAPQIDSVHTEQRVVINYFTAKRLFNVLAMTVQRHEAAFGQIEVNVERRLGGHGMA